MTDLIDAAGIPLSEHRRWLPPRVSLFPPGQRVKNAKAVREWREQCAGTRCWYCGQGTSHLEWAPNHGELHHIVRTDCPWAFFWACAECHRINKDVTKSDNLYQVLRLKHYHDRENTHWPELAILMKRFLPEG